MEYGKQNINPGVLAMVCGKKSNSGKESGYTLIELLVVVALVGIISAIAFPAYQGYLTDTYRAQAMTDLKVCALSLERYFSDGFTYVGAEIGDDANTDECDEDSPTQGGAQYVISFPSDPTQNDFTIQAIPIGVSSCAGECIRLSADGTQEQF
jgi:type IV pilus assembly protein PilE